MKYMTIELINYKIHKVNTSWWKQLMALFLKTGVPFEIRCWREETDILEKACTFGTLSEEKSTAYEVSVTGILTSSIIHQILSDPKPDHDEQMCRYFTINVGEQFCSAHYGKEIYIVNPTDHICHQIQAQFASIKDYFVFGESE